MAESVSSKGTDRSGDTSPDAVDVMAKWDSPSRKPLGALQSNEGGDDSPASSDAATKAPARSSRGSSGVSGVRGSGGSRSGAGIQVVVRLRPMSDKEKKYGTLPVVTASTADRTVTVVKDKHSRQARLTYSFNDVFTAFSTQEEVFDRTLRPVIGDVLRGFESTVFAYGQTGTGKTHTMEGDLDEPDMHGVIPRSAAALFDALGGEEYTESRVTASYLEIYNEELCDLLVVEGEGQHQDGGGSGNGSRPVSRASSTVSRSSAASASDNKSKRPLSARGSKPKLEIMEGKAGPFCRGLSEREVSSPRDVLDLMTTAAAQRRIGETKMNKQSSRSHCIFTLKVHAKCTLMDGGGTMECNGKLHMVDLAGSECAKSAGSGSDGGGNSRGLERERMNINRSLLTLGRVISILKAQSEGKTKNSANARIPYRDSKLTRVLQESLGGRCKTVIVATLSPSVTAIEESLSTLNYAQTANGIVNKPVASSYLKVNSSAPDGSGSRGAGSEPHDYKAVEDWNEMEIRLQYMQAQVEEAQGALARKHVLQAEAEERAVLADERAEGLETTLEEIGGELTAVRGRLEEETAGRVTAEDDLATTRENLAAQTTRAESAEEEGRRLESELKAAHDTAESLRKDLAEEITLKEAALNSLRETRIDLAKTRAVLDASRQTEESLTSEAEALLGTLRSSIADGDGLHAMVRDHASDDIARREAARAFHESSAATLDETLSALGELSSNAAAVCASISTRSDARADSARESVEQTSEMFAALSAHIGELASNVRARLVEEGGIVPAVRSAADAGTVGTNEAVRIVLDSEEDLSASFNFLRARLSDHASEAGRLWAVHDANGTKALSDLERGVDAARGKIEEMASSAAEALRKARESQRERREGHSALLTEWEKSSRGRSEAMGSCAEGGAEAATDALGTFESASRGALGTMDGTLAGVSTFLAREGDEHVSTIDELRTAIEERRVKSEEERETQKRMREEFVKGVMEGVRSLVDERMDALSAAQDTHFDEAREGHDALAARNIRVSSGAAKILEETKGANAAVKAAAEAARENDEKAAEAMGRAVKTLEELREEAVAHGTETDTFARKAERDVAELAKLDDEIGCAGDDGDSDADANGDGGGESRGGIAGRIVSDRSDVLDHLAGAVLSRGREGIEFLAASGGDIAHHADATIIPECSAAVEGMERPRAAVIEQLRSKAKDVTESLEAGVEEVEALAEEQCGTADEVRTAAKEARDKYGEGVAKASKAEIDAYRGALAAETAEYETDARGALSGCSSKTETAKSDVERFVVDVLKAREEVPPVTERSEFPYEETLSSTPAEEELFKALDLSTIDAVAT